MKTKQVYEEPQWKVGFSRFWRKFCNGWRAMADAFCDDVASSFINGLGFVTEKIFSWAGNALDPVIAARIFIGAAAAVIVWGLYSWCWIGITFGSYLGIPAEYAGLVGFVSGVLLNIAEILPEVGQLFKEYANVLGRAGEEAKARAWLENGISAETFNGFTYDQLKTGRNVGLGLEFVVSFIYKLAVGGFTKTVIKANVPVIQLLDYGPMMGSVAWCLTLVFVPELTIRLAAAALHITSTLPERNYT